MSLPRLLLRDLPAAWLAAVYAGYPAATALAAFLARRPVRKNEGHLPSIALVVTAYNEERWIGAKLENALALDYPKGQLTIAVGVDGATDATRRVAESHAAAGVRVLAFPKRRGKVSVMNDVAAATESELLLFSDANAFYRPDALRKIARNFADPAVGAVCGRLVLEGRHYASVTRPETVYWRYDDLLKELETATGSTVGVVGSIFAVRRDLFRPLPADTVCDDLEMALAVIARGRRVVYEPEAVAREGMTASTSKELTRKVRLVSGGLAAARRHAATALGRPEAGLKLLFHKIMRWLAFIPLALIAGYGLVERRRGNPWPLRLQAAFYLCPLPEIAANLLRQALTGRRDIKVRHTWFPFYFALVNLAAAAGFLRHLAGGQSARWAVTRE